MCDNDISAAAMVLLECDVQKRNMHSSEFRVERKMVGVELMKSPCKADG